MVRIPVKFPTSNFSESKLLALKRMLGLEQRLESSSSFKYEYRKFVNEYIDLGHISINLDPESGEKNYCFPHHGIVKRDRLTVCSMGLRCLIGRLSIYAIGKRLRKQDKKVTNRQLINQLLAIFYQPHALLKNFETCQFQLFY